jgi:hypothetical protein
MTTAREETIRLADLLRREHQALAVFLVALADFDRRRVWVALGHTSLFYFLHRELELPKGPAYYRKTAAELIQQYPEIVEPLRDGRLHLTSIVELSKVITPENRAEVLPRFFHTSKREAKEVRAELCPDESPATRESVTPVRCAAPVALSLAANVVLPEEPPRANPSVPGVASAQVPALRVEPLTAELSRLNITVTRDVLQKLDAARDALSHSHRGASAAAIIEVGLDLILERQAKRRGLVKNPRKSAAATPTATASRAPSRYVPAHIRRAVWERDRGCCQFRLESGAISSEPVADYDCGLQ